MEMMSVKWKSERERRWINEDTVCYENSWCEWMTNSEEW